jgi:hypothetical protein
MSTPTLPSGCSESGNFENIALVLLFARENVLSESLKTAKTLAIRGGR